MDIKAKLVKTFDSGSIKAVFDVTLDDKFAIHGVKLMKGSKGDFISMPSTSYKTKNGETKYSDTFHAITADARTALVEAVNDAYEQKLQEQMEQKGDAPGQAMGQQM